MTTSAIHARPLQIAELSRGLRLPLPPIEDAHLEILGEGLVRAFHDILNSAPSAVHSGSEAEISALLESRLNALIEDDPLWGQLVLCVARGKESLSFDGAHLEKRPDLSIYLTNRSRSFPVVVEAKIIDGPTGKTAALYCQQGLSRFLIGDYGWGGQEAFMIAYVRDGSDIASGLAPRLAAKGGVAPFATEADPVAIGLGAADCARSKHGRSFTYGHQAPPAHLPGSIALLHIWVNAAMPPAAS
jgi:hypothetical protein